MPRYSANLGFLWASLPLPERIARAGAAGFKAVELHFPYDVPASETQAACRAAGVELVSLNTPPQDAFGLGAMPGREAEFKEGFAQALDYARTAGAAGIHVMAGVVPAQASVEATATFRDNLIWAAAEVQGTGMTLLLEPLNPRDRPGYFYSTLGRAEEMIARVGSPAVKIMFDVYNIAVAEGDVLNRLRRHFPRIGHVQIAGVPSRAEPDEGEIDYRHVLGELAALGWRGWIGCEYRPRGDVEAGLGWMKRVEV